MAITLYDLAGVEADRRFSPFCWRTRMALAHKGLEVETVPWRFTEKDKLPQPNGGRVPVIVDGGQVVHDSSTIAEYLENRYPDRPSLFGGEAGRALDPVRAELDRDRAAARPDRLCRARHPPPYRARGPGLFPAIARGAVRQNARGGRQGPRCAAAGLPRKPDAAAPHRRAPGFSRRRRPRPMPITSCSAPSSGPARSATSSCSPPTTRSPPGAGACSTCSAASPARAPPTAAERMAGTSAIATVALILHALSAVVWVGGMFFAHQVLRPATAALDPGPRLLLWSRVLGRFFAWVIAAIVLLLVSGYVHGVRGLRRLRRGRPARPPDAGHRHPDDAVVLPPLFRAVAPLSRWRSAREDWAEGGRQLGQIRTIVTINLVLGLIVVAIGSSGRYWG